MLSRRALCLGLVLAPAVHAADTDVAAAAINALGLDLHRQLAKAGGNTCLSPYSIQIGLAMAYAGADGTTRAEMARVLHYPADEAALHASMGALADHLAAIQAESVEFAQRTERHGGWKEPVVLSVANRLFLGRVVDPR